MIKHLDGSNEKLLFELVIIGRIRIIIPFDTQNTKENHISPKYPESTFIAKDCPRKYPGDDE